MIIFPAIDIKNGQCVRLRQGDFKAETNYDLSPLQAALAYEQDGASWLHIIDLDGAQGGDRKNIDLIKEILLKTHLKLQVGGGIRSKKDIETLLNLGINRVIVGTYALEKFEELKDLIKIYPGRIIVSLDAKDGYIRTYGWTRKTGIKTIDFIKRLETIQIDTVVVTDIAKDGMMQGPNVDQLKGLNAKTSMNIIASGGVSSLADIQVLKASKLYGAIIGKALYMNAIHLKEAIICSQEESYPV